MATANLNDMATLQTDPTIGNRIMAGVTIACAVNIPSEAVASTAEACQLHIARKNLGSAILNNPASYKAQFVAAVCCNQTVANDATVSGTIVGQTGSTLAASALLCTDTDINNAIASSFNAFISNI